MMKEEEKLVREGAEVLAAKGAWVLEDSILSLRLKVLHYKVQVISAERTIEIGEAVLARAREP